MFPVSPTSLPVPPPPSPALPAFLVEQRRQSDIVNQLLRELGECTQTASQLLDLVYYNPLSDRFPSSPISSTSAFSNLWTPASKIPSSPVFQRPDLSTYTSSPAQAQPFASRWPTSSLAAAPHRTGINSPINPNGPFESFSPGELSLDGHAQRVYNGFVYNVPLPGETGQLYLVTVGRRVGIIAGWTATAPYVVGVSHATCCKVRSFGEGTMALLRAIDKKVARWVA